MLSLPKPRWTSEAKKLRSETLVFLIRRTHRLDDHLCGQFMEHLRKRIKKQARRFCTDLDQVDREEVLLAVEMKIFELLLTTKPSRRRDFLEIAFAQAIKDFTDDERVKLGNSPSGNVVDYVAAVCEDDEEEAIERPIEVVPAQEPEPEETLLNLDSRKHRHRLVRKALEAVADRRHREAVILHFGKDWPMTSKKRGVDTLQRYFRKDPREIRYWLDTAMKQMRNALGVQSIGHRPRIASSQNGAAVGRVSAREVYGSQRSAMVAAAGDRAPQPGAAGAAAERGQRPPFPVGPRD